jgi:hypothetical protein
MSKPTITTHYADGRVSEVREMTDGEFENYEALIAHAVSLADSE